MAGALELSLKFHEPIEIGEDEGKKKQLDCGTRTVILPSALPPLGDDFVWEARDFDGFRLAMLEELAARFPERTQWTPADLEVVLVEVLSWALDQLSDMLDRVTAEAYLETARRPDSVRRLLELIGYELIGYKSEEAVDKEWAKNPLLKEAARRAGPKAVRQQRRMVSVDDYAAGMELHPLVRRAVSSTRWNGSWHCILVTVILWDWKSLDDSIKGLSKTFRALLEEFHGQHGLPPLTEGCRIIDSLQAWADSRRMVGQEVIFGEAIRVGVIISLDVTVADQYYKSEVLQAVRSIFNAQEGGFFEIGRLSFGTHLNKSDVIEAVMQLEGIESVDVNVFRRFDSEPASEDSVPNSNAAPNSNAVPDSIALEGFEVAVCDSNPDVPQNGTLIVKCKGGLKG